MMFLAGIFMILSVSCASSLPKKGMEVYAPAKAQKFDDSAPIFSGNVSVRGIVGGHGYSDLTSAEVEFTPNARSAWHTHPRGQLLIVTKGSGLVQEWGKEAKSMKAGQVVWTPAGVKHWHGATDKTSVTHYAIQELVDGPGTNVNWLEKVSDETFKLANKVVNE